MLSIRAGCAGKSIPRCISLEKLMRLPHSLIRNLHRPTRALYSSIGTSYRQTCDLYALIRPFDRLIRSFDSLIRPRCILIHNVRIQIRHVRIRIHDARIQIHRGRIRLSNGRIRLSKERIRHYTIPIKQSKKRVQGFQTRKIGSKRSKYLSLENLMTQQKGEPSRIS